MSKLSNIARNPEVSQPCAEKTQGPERSWCPTLVAGATRKQSTCYLAASDPQHQGAGSAAAVKRSLLCWDRSWCFLQKLQSHLERAVQLAIIVTNPNFRLHSKKKKKKKSHMFYFICIRKVENHWVRRCRLSGGAMSLGSDLEIPVCSFCLLDQGVSSQCFLLPCLCASITDSNSLKQKPQLNSFFCKFSWPWCFITATKGNETAGHSGAFL